ncbi:MAG TPA: TonB family protein [Polyangia bacterium]|nr:TonB family protein [Polyangia bacterium]HVZ89725.1 TonB family protein [Polyangia bacterium]
MKRRVHPIAGYAISAIAHLGLFAWAWALPVRAHRSEHVDVQIVETVKPRPVEPKPPPPEPPKPAAPIKMHLARRVAQTPPPPTNTPPPETPPPETPQPTTTQVTPGPVHLGISLSSTSAGGAFAAPVGNSLAGKPGPRAQAPATDDIGPVAHAAALSEQPAPLDTSIPDDEYPKEARDSGFEGQVVLRLLIDAKGRVRKASILKDPGHGLGAAAVKSVRHFTFSPGKLDGKPTATEIAYTVTYELPG